MKKEQKQRNQTTMALELLTPKVKKE